MALRQQLRIDDRVRIRKCFAKIVMICDDYIHAARVGIVYGFVGSNACITGEDQFCAIINNWLKRLDMNAMPLLAANGYIKSDVRFHGSKRLYQQCRGSLSIHIKVAPNADGFIILYSRIYARNSLFNPWECREGNRAKMEKCLRRARRFDTAPHESLGNKRVQIQILQRGCIDGLWVEPAIHLKIGRAHV